MFFPPFKAVRSQPRLTTITTSTDPFRALRRHSQTKLLKLFRLSTRRKDLPPSPLWNRVAIGVQQ